MLLTLLLAALIGGLSAAAVVKWYKPSNEELITEFYKTENAVHVSPHSIRAQMSKGHGNFVLVDLRSQEEYEKEHIVGAVSIPAYKDKDTSAYDEVDRIVKSFQELGTDRDIIVYCYSIPCMTGRKVGKMLAENGIYVKLLGIGWNEWRYFWNLWNHEHEWAKTKVEDFIAKGKEPGKYAGAPDQEACDIKGDLGC